MYYYKVFGYIFRSQYEISQLYAVPATDAYDVDIIIGRMPDEILAEISEIEERPYMYWAEDYFWLTNRYGTLAVYKDGRIYAHNPEAEDLLYLLQFVLGYGIAIYAHMHDRITIHCGCVAISGDAIIISGNSGSGKSTLTNEFISDGAIMLSDDIVAIGYDENHQPCVYPAFPQQKLCRDAALQKGYDLDQLIYIDPDKDKYAVIHSDQFSTEPHHLNTFVSLKCFNAREEKHSSEDIQFLAVDGFDKIKLLMKCLYLGPWVTERGVSAEVFQLFVDLLKDCNVYQIKRRKGVDTLAEMKAFVEQHHSNPYLEFIRSVLNQTMPSPDIVSSITPEELYRFASLNKMVPFFVPILDAWSPANDTERDCLIQWKQEAKEKVLCEYRKLALTKQLIDAAQEADISLTFFKGYVLADLYPDFTMRTSSDTDLFIHKGDFERTATLLESLHYQRVKSLDTANVFTFVYKEDGPPLHKIELHTSLFEDMKGPQIEYLESMQLEASTLPLECCSTVLQTMSHQNHLIYQIFHLVKHLCFHGLPIRYLLDTALFIQQYGKEIDWKDFSKSMEHLGYSCFWRHFATLMITHFHVSAEILNGEKPGYNSTTSLLLQDLLWFGMRSQERELSRNFYLFETHLEACIEKGIPYGPITFDGNTVPYTVVPSNMQQHPILQQRIRFLEHLELL